MLEKVFILFLCAGDNSYASDIMSFCTPSEEETVSSGTNVATLAKGASIAGVSSEWSSRGDGNEAFITVTLAEPTPVTGFGLFTRTMGSSAEISPFEVENEVGEVFGPFDLSDANGIYDFPVDAGGQAFTSRMVDSSGGNTGVVELAIYSEEAP